MKRLWTCIAILSLTAAGLAGAGIASPGVALATGCTVGTSASICTAVYSVSGVNANG